MEEDDGYRTQSPDTSREAEEFLLDAHRRMTAQEKCRWVASLTRAGHELALHGLRLRYPDASERELELRLAARSIDRGTMIEAFGWAPPDEGE